MIELAAYVLGWAVLAIMALGAAAQLIWQGRRVLKASPWWKGNALLIIGLTIAAVAPPYSYRALDRMILCAALVIVPCLVALIGDPGRWKLLSLLHIGSACAWLYVCIQAAR